MNIEKQQVSQFQTAKGKNSYNQRPQEQLIVSGSPCLESYSSSTLPLLFRLLPNQLPWIQKNMKSFHMLLIFLFEILIISCDILLIKSLYLRVSILLNGYSEYFLFFSDCVVLTSRTTSESAINQIKTLLSKKKHLLDYTLVFLNKQQIFFVAYATWCSV